MSPGTEAFLDIETTGLSPVTCQITVVGIYVCRGESERFVQLVSRDACVENILEALDGVDIIYTYNGSRFDIPFIHSCIGVNLAETYTHRDLMYDCWNRNLYGGFKGVERQLGISRKLKEVDGLEAVRLWFRYLDSFDQEALKKLLDYNEEDVKNLKVLKEKLFI